MTEEVRRTMEMKFEIRQSLSRLIVFCMIGFCPLLSSQANAQQTDTKGGQLTESEIQERRIYRRAVEAAIWSQPLMGTNQTRAAGRAAGGDYNSVIYLSRPGNWKYRILTPNDTVLYAMVLTNTAIDGPVVIEIPSSRGAAVIAGGILDSFQDPLNDVGAGGDDAGAGGKYLLFEAGDNSPAPPGYIPVRSERNIAWSMLRVVPRSLDETDLDAAIEEIKKLRVYPLSQAGNPPKTEFIDIYDKIFDTVFPLDATYYDVLAGILNEETVTDLDKAFLSMMTSFGYRRGEPFAPSAETRAILDRAIKDAARELVFGVAGIAPAFWDGSSWTALGREPTFSTGFSFITEDVLDYDLRGAMYSYVCCGGIKLGVGTNLYLKASYDGAGELLDGGTNYRVTVPSNAPTEQFWSFMAYDALTAVYYEDVSRPGLSSLTTDLKINPDGSTDVYFGPDMPSGNESNWIPTKPNTTLLILFRLYGITDGARDGSWVLPGLERLD
jgi:hypothetical protein